MVKAYYGFSSDGLWGLVASRNVPFVTIDSNISKKVYNTHAVVVATVTGSLISLWDLRKTEKITTIGSLEEEVISSLVYPPESGWLIAGYVNGRIRVFSLETNQLLFLINAHSSPVSSVAVNISKLLLASGSSAGDIVLWDWSAERGICRLKGHTNEITKLQFYSSDSKPYLISSSKDSLLKVWDLNGFYCIQTIVSHQGEIWNFTLHPKLDILISVSAQPELHVFGVLKSETEKLFKGNQESVSVAHHDDLLVSLGTLARKSSTKLHSVCFDNNYCHLAFYGNDKSLELYQVRDLEHAVKHMKRRRKRKAAEDNQPNGNEQLEDNLSHLQASDFLIYRQTLQFAYRLRSISFLSMHFEFSKMSKLCHEALVCQFVDNAVELCHLVYETDDSSAFGLKRISSLDTHGHRGDVRNLAFSKNQNYVLSVSSAKTAKLWQIANTRCLRTISLTGYGTCCLFLCNDVFMVMGTKEGTLQIHYTLTGDSILHIEDHRGPIWSMCLTSNEQYLITGGGDKKIYFYEIQIDQSSTALPTIHLEQIRSMDMTDEVLCLKVSPDGKLLIIALLDCTVRAFHLDSLKFYLSFYGHKMPVLSMDVTSDSTLLITGSADKSIKIWGLDFGDLHKSILEHENAVMSIVCQPNTHYFFSASRDGYIRYWDADVFQRIMTLEGHFGEVWCLAISLDGEMLVSAGHDKSIRLWRRTNEQLFLEEEQEKRIDKTLESSIIQERNWIVGNLESSMHHSTLGMEWVPEASSSTTLNNMDIVTNTEKLLETLGLVQKDYQREQENPKERPDVQLLGLSRQAYLLRTLLRIRTSDLESVLIMLPYHSAVELLSYVSVLLDSPSGRFYTDILCRVILFLTHLHRLQIMHGMDRGQMERLAKGIHQIVNKGKKMIGFNIAAMKMIQRDEPELVKMPKKQSRDTVSVVESKKGSKKKKKQ